MNNYFVSALVLVVGVVLGFIVGTSQEPTPSAKVETKETEVSTVVALENHIQLNLPEQDVFIEVDGNPDMVFRVEGEAASDPVNLAKQAFSVATEQRHDAFKLGENPLGPFKKGSDLGFTLGEWLAAEGGGTYTVQNGEAALNLTFSDLVPNGVYTLWCSRLSFPPTPSVVDLPCGSIDGSSNTFVADTNGNASVQGLAVPPFGDSTEATTNVVALAYHSDGETYGVKPGPFGSVAHVQLAFLFPTP